MNDPIILPHSIEAEQAVLGGLMLDNKSWQGVSNLLLEEDFCRPEHGIIFNALSDLFSRNIPVEVLILSDFLKQKNQLDQVKGEAYLFKLAKNTPSAVNILAYAEIVQARSIYRQQFKIFQEGQKSILSGNFSLEESIQKLNKSNNRKVKNWEPPVLFEDLETPIIPVELLPTGVYREFAKALSNSTETPTALAVMAIFGVISTCITKCYVVSPKDDWKESLNIYTLVALPPANNKSLILSRCTAPLIEWQKQEAERLQPEINRLISSQKTIEAIIAKKRKDSANAKIIDRSNILNEIHELEESLPKIRFLPELFSTDATPESLAKCAYEQGGRFAIISDEGGIMDVVAGLYTGNNSNIDILLKGIDGGELRINRQSSKMILKPYFTIMMTVQPVIIKNMCTRNVFKGKGLIERFLFVLPKSQLGYRQHNREAVPRELSQKYHQAIIELITRHSISEDLKPIVLRLDELALKEWKDFQLSIEKELRDGGQLSTLRGWGGKISGMALRLAGLIHVASEPHSQVITSKTMDKALELAVLLMQHAIAAYGMMRTDEDIGNATYIFRWLLARKESQFTQSDLSYALRHQDISKERKNKAIQILIERNIISESRILPGRSKPTTFYLVNPGLWGGAHELA
jgi:hypothetical protein